MLDKTTKPNQQWHDLIYQIILTYNNNLIHFATEFTPSDAKKPSNELMTYINMKVKAKHNRRYLDIHIGDNVNIDQKQKL